MLQQNSYNPVEVLCLVAPRRPSNDPASERLELLAVASIFVQALSRVKPPDRRTALAGNRDSIAGHSVGGESRDHSTQSLGRGVRLGTAGTSSPRAIGVRSVSSRLMIEMNPEPDELRPGVFWLGHSRAHRKGTIRVVGHTGHMKNRAHEAPWAQAVGTTSHERYETTRKPLVLQCSVADSDSHRSHLQSDGLG